MRKFMLSAFALLVLAGCADHQPIVDLRGQDTVRYQQDLFECQQYAKQVSPMGDAAIGGLGGAAGGAALGAVGGALLPGVSAGGGAIAGALAGGVLGAGGGGLVGASEQQKVIDNCLRGRGYNVLN